MSGALSEAEQTAVVTQHVRLVTKVARSILAEQPSWVRFDDLVGAGHEGLLDAARRYDPSRGATFATYAHYRIRGAMLDWVRDHTSRDPVARVRAAAAMAVDDLLGAVAGDHDLSAVTSDGAASLLAATLFDAAAALALGELAAESVAPPAEDPETVATRRETASRLAGAIDALPARERDILRGVYLDGLTIEQSGQAMGLTKGWSSRLHARALGLLRDALSGLEAHLGAEP